MMLFGFTYKEHLIIFLAAVVALLQVAAFGWWGLPLVFFCGWASARIVCGPWPKRRKK